MKTHFLSLLLLIAAPLSPVKAAPLPASVQARVPRGVVALRLFYASLGPNEPGFFVHAWTAPRFYSNADAALKTLPTPNDVTGNRVAPSPFVLDIFSSENEKTPRYITSIAYLSTRAPQAIEAHYLNGKTKKGRMFIVTDSFEKLSSTTYFVFPDDLSGDYRSWNQPRRWSGSFFSFTSVRYIPDGVLELDHFSQSDAPNDTGQHEFLRWNGHEFAVHKRVKFRKKN